MIEAAIIDDEPSAGKTLALLLKEHCPQITIQGNYQQPAVALKKLKENPVELIFLDIEMPILNGFAFLEKLQPQNCGVIFTTAYDQYAIKAFSYSAFDYLLKPIDGKELEASVARFEKSSNKKDYSHFAHLFEAYKNISTQLPQKIIFPTQEGYEFITINSIIRCEAADNYSRLYFGDNNSLIVCKTLKEIEQILNEQKFLRIHHSHLINREQIRRIIKADGGFVQMTDGTQLPIARRRKNDILEELTR